MKLHIYPHLFNHLFYFNMYMTFFVILQFIITATATLPNTFFKQTTTAYCLLLTTYCLLLATYCYCYMSPNIIPTMNICLEPWMLDVVILFVYLTFFNNQRLLVTPSEHLCRRFTVFITFFKANVFL